MEVIFAFEFDLITLSWKLSTRYWKKGIFFKQSFFMDNEKGILLIKYLEWWNVAVRLDRGRQVMITTNFFSECVSVFHPYLNFLIILPSIIHISKLCRSPTSNCG